MLHISSTIRIPDHEFRWTFARSSGPGGQNVNKVASKAVLRWSVVQSVGLPEEVKTRLRPIAGSNWTADGDLIVTSQKYRDQGRNRQDCLDKLAALIRQAATRPRSRIATKPGRAARERRLTAKRHRSRSKQARRLPLED
jgi:ribosome-associated protein